MDRLEAMSALLAAVEAGSLTAASRRLGMPLATVSRKVSELEAHLGTQLITRTSRRFSLTEAGQSYVAACKRILEEIGEAERAAKGEYREPKGDLTVSVPIVFGRTHVLPVALEFLAAYPDIDLRLDLSDRVVNLFEEPVDLAVRIAELGVSSLIAAKIGTTRRSICASPSYFGRKGVPQKPEDLARHDCITFEGLSAPKVWVLGRDGSEVQVQLRSRLIVNTAEAAIDAAIAGLGIARVFCYQIAQAMRDGKLLAALETYEPAPTPVSLVYPGHGLLPLKLRAFLDFARPRLKARLAVGEGSIR